jgi:hypothetical protein
MRVLRYVGQGEDEQHLLIETVDGGEQFSLPLSDDLRQAAGTDLPRLTHNRPRDNPISPREIQVRVRGGESPEDLAKQVDMPLDRVLRFASAVMAERARVTGEARTARARHTGADGEFVVFGEHVDSRFSAHGIDVAEVVWDAYRNEDGQWVVSASWQGGDLRRIARWGFVLAARTITPLDDTAADLLSDRPIRPVVHVVYDTPIADPADSPTGPIPRPGLHEPLFDQLNASAPDAIAVLPLRLPDLPPGLTFASTARHADETDEEHAARARIPSWDDILMGVRRKRD